VTVRPESWRPLARRGAPPLFVAVALAGLVVFLASWALLHVGFYERDQVRDTPLYQRYGDRIEDGELPYRDVRVEYPPGALPTFVVPSLLADEGDQESFRRWFETLMWVAGAVCLLGVVLTLSAVGASAARLTGAAMFVAASPLALGSVFLSRYDLWPAALTALALAAFVSGRERVGLAVLGLGAATKVYPALLAPLFFAFLWRTRGRREALVGAGLFVAAIALVVLPFAVLSPDGVWAALTRQASRGLQIESLGSAVLLAAHHVAGVGIEMRSSAGSQNLVGTAPDVLAAVHTAVQGLAIAAVWVAFARGPVDRERLLWASATCVCAFVALGKVVSPQFLIWLIPLVPLVRGRRGIAASAVLGLALVLTQLWFPYRYWDLALEFDEPASWLVLVRDLVLLGLLAVLAWSGAKTPVARNRTEPGPARS
jgi:Glycosyltransferase family 87